MTPSAPAAVSARAPATRCVLVDDAMHVREQLAAWLASDPQDPAQWVLIACAPRMTHRIGKWVSYSSREHWREKWADKLFLQLVPLLRSKGLAVQTDTATVSIADVVDDLSRREGCVVMDWRKPRGVSPSHSGGQGRVHWAYLPAMAALASLHECA